MSDNIRFMLRSDTPELLNIEYDSFDDPWTAERFKEVTSTPSMAGAVAVLEDRILGYIVYEMNKTSLWICRLAVSPVHRRCGVGQALVAKLAAKLQYERRNKLMIDVRESSTVAHLFLKKCGFTATNVLRGHFTDTREDAYRFVWRLPKVADVLQQAG